MPPSESTSWAETGAADEVDDYIRARRARRARTAVASANLANLDLLSADAEFSWDAGPSPRAGNATPSVVRGELLEEPSGDAWRAAARARDAAPASPDQVLDAWGARIERGDLVEPIAAAGRRTVVITGRGAERYPAPHRRSYSASLRPYERAGFRPDRVAMWAFVLAVAVMLVAVTSSQAAVFIPH